MVLIKNPGEELLEAKLFFREIADLNWLLRSTFINYIPKLPSSFTERSEAYL